MISNHLNYRYAFFGILFTVLIACSSFLPGGRLPLCGKPFSQPIIVNLAHVPAYATVTIFWIKTFKSKEAVFASPKMGVLVMLGLVLFAFSDEIHQSFIPGRETSFVDIGLDLIGIFLGLAAMKALKIFGVFWGK